MSRNLVPLFVLCAAAAAFAACPGGGTAPNAGSDAGTDAGPSSGNNVDAGDSGMSEPMDADMMTPMDAGMDAGACDPLTGAGGMVSMACRTCVENSSACSGDITSYSSDCTAYSSCLCACGGGRNCAQTCQSSITSTCQNDIQSLGTCAAQNCASECVGGGRDGGFSLDAGYVDGGTFPDGGNWCAALADCCPSLPFGQSQCTSLANTGNAPDCERTLQGAQGRGICLPPDGG